MGASGPNKRATLTTCLLKKEELIRRSLLDEKGKRQPTRVKAPLIKKKEFLTLDSGC
jgi:hypothetical protein